MALADLPRVTKELTNKELSNILAMVLKELEFVINGRLDVKNIKADGIEARNIKAGSITADKISVDELSAIAADLGHITAGLIEAVDIYASYFATSKDSFPRVVIDPAGNYIAVYTSPTAYMLIQPGVTDAPNITGYESGDLKYILGTSFGIANFQSVNSLFVRAGTDLSLICGSGGSVQTTGWSQFRSIADGQSLADALNNLATAIAGKATKGSSTGSAGSASLNGGIPVGTQLAVAGGGFVTWGGISVPSHSHTQT